MIYEVTEKPITVRAKNFSPQRKTNNDMSVIRKFFGEQRVANEKVLSIYLTAGYPRAEDTLPLLDTLVAAGADMIELGVPFSDPLADGPTIQMASQKALENGTTMLQCINTARLFKSRHPEVPVLLMGYANPFYKFGLQRLVDMCAAAAVDGFIIPDLPPEEADELVQMMHAADMDLVFLASPNTPDERLATINHQSRGFIYAVSIAGVTGARKKLPRETEAFLKRLRRASDHPLMIGFGISSPEMAATMCGHGHGVIIGSAVIDLIARNPELKAAQTAVFDFVNRVKFAMRKSRK